MKRISVSYLTKQTEPGILYNIKVYHDLDSETPEEEFRTRSSRDEIDLVEPLSVVMAYLHLHPVETVKLDEKTAGSLRPNLEVIIQAHNHAISKIGRDL